jgi:hypothetical protein
MPKHARAQIRDAVHALVENLPSVGEHVARGRAQRPPDGVRRMLFVSTGAESSERIASSPPICIRAVVVRVEAVVLDDEPDDLLDEICAEVEERLTADPRLGGLAKDVMLVATNPESQNDQDYPRGFGELQFRVQYWTVETDPRTAV